MWPPQEVGCVWNVPDCVALFVDLWAFSFRACYTCHTTSRWGPLLIQTVIAGAVLPLKVVRGIGSRKIPEVFHEMNECIHRMLQLQEQNICIEERERDPMAVKLLQVVGTYMKMF